MYRKLLIAAMIAGAPFALSATATATEPGPSAPASDPAYSSETDLGTLLDNPATKAVLEKHVPQLVSNEQVAMARVLTLRQMQSYASEMLTDEVLAKIDADLAKVPKK